jgi:predicted nucleic acid-binding protein
MVCLDTSVLVALIRKDPEAMDGLRAEAEAGGVVSTTLVNLCELYSGAYGSNAPQKELERVEHLLTHVRLLGFDISAARRYGELVNDDAIKSQQIGDFDLIIASITLENNEELVTRNLKHFGRVPGLIVKRW